MTKLNFFRKTRADPLQEFVQLTKKHRSDKWTAHDYSIPYFTHFSPIRSHRLNILEIGIGGWDGSSYSNPSRGGESLRFWRDYFYNSNIFAIDIQDKSPLQEDRITIFQGSQTDSEFLNGVLQQVGSVDIIIDDGSHVNLDVIFTFKKLFPALASDGIYVVEDTQTSYWPSKPGEGYGGDAENMNNSKTSMGYFKGLIDGLNHSEFLKPSYSPSCFDKHIVSIHFYHNLIFIKKGDNNSASNIVKDSSLEQ